jgi:hypothetical protein
MHHLHPSPPARLAVYALFAFSLSLQTAFVRTQGAAMQVVTLFCLAVSLTLALAAVYVALSTPAPLTTSPPPSASSALGSFLVAAWLAPFHYFVFYLALLVLSIMVAVPVDSFHVSDPWLAGLVLVALGGCFVLEYVFLFVLRVAADSVPAPLQLPLDQEPPRGGVGALSAG